VIYNLKKRRKQMQVNLNCNCPKPQFGMAFRTPINSKCCPNKVNDFVKYIGLPKNERALKAYADRMSKLNRFDVEVAEDGTMGMNVIDKVNEKVVYKVGQSPEGVTGLRHFGSFDFLGKNLLYKIFKPEQALPYNMIHAAETAEKLEKEALTQKKSLNILKNL
jgi:hypothetical protein